MRATVALLLIALSLAGCADGPEGSGATEAFPLDVYRFQYEGSDHYVQGVEHGWLLRVHNPTNSTQTVTAIPSGIASGHIGPIAATGGDAGRTAWLPGRVDDNQFGPPLVLAPNASGLFMAKVESYVAPPEGTATTVGVRLLALAADAVGDATTQHTLSWQVQPSPASGQPVVAGDHVQTVTVGVWTNGTSFYSNAAGALQDPSFPHGEGWTSASDGTAPLTVYVYDQSGDEQPAASQDACYFPTIPGYNSLLKMQAEGSTNVALLQPEAAYTREERSGHRLYGDALVFLNTVVVHDGATGPADAIPNPTGPCFGNRLEDVPAAD